MSLKKYIKNIHHATAIYQCNKLEKLLEFEKDLRIKYQKFLIDSNEPDILDLLIGTKQEQRKVLNKEIREIKHQINIINKK